MNIETTSAESRRDSCSLTSHARCSGKSAGLGSIVRMAVRRWRLVLRPSRSLPSMAWVLRARPPVAEITFGRLVRPSDAGIFEGTWAGDPDALGPLRATTPFGSGVLVEGEAVHIIPPGHMLEGLY